MHMNNVTFLKIIHQGFPSVAYLQFITVVDPATV